MEKSHERTVPTVKHGRLIASGTGTLLKVDDMMKIEVFEFKSIGRWRILGQSSGQ